MTRHARHAYLRSGDPIALYRHRARRSWWEPLVPALTALAGILCIAGTAALLWGALILASPWGTR